MSEMADVNQQVIDEFRANDGAVGGMFDGMDLVLLTTTGAKSGAERIAPLVYYPDGDRIVVIASKGGAPEHPAWYHNIRANPRVTAEVGSERFAADAVPIEGDERDALYTRIAQALPQFGEYQASTTRKIPLIELKRV
jgi:deazaflavin-dependent oxidoreductase (nitroreductase family)